MHLKVLKLIPALLATLLAGNGLAAEDPYRNIRAGAMMAAVAEGLIGTNVEEGEGYRRWGAPEDDAFDHRAVASYVASGQAQLALALRKDLERIRVAIEKMGDGVIRLKLDTQASFAINSVALKPGFARTLGRLARVLRKYSKTLIYVSGHTDSRGSRADNMTLSRQRAKAVAGYLARQGVDPARIYSEGLGETEPLGDNDTEEGRRKNRRAEIYLELIIDVRGRLAYRLARHFR
ncbi:MAG: OmpA family protein [Halieaceae bacterium]|nr:OmpA family protein [Halieaceae bacterium]